MRLPVPLFATVKDPFVKSVDATPPGSYGEAIALLNRNKPTAYIIPAKTYEKLMDLAEDIELGRIIEERKAEKADAVEVSLDEL